MTHNQAVVSVKPREAMARDRFGYAGGVTAVAGTIGPPR
jgi:hypothetical protein